MYSEFFAKKSDLIPSAVVAKINIKTVFRIIEVLTAGNGFLQDFNILIVCRNKNIYAWVNVKAFVRPLLFQIGFPKEQSKNQELPKTHPFRDQQQ